MRRAAHANQLLSDSLLAESVLAVEEDIIQQLRQVKLDDHEAHSRLVMALQVAGAVRRRLWIVIQEGDMAREQLSLRGKRID